MQKTWTTTKVTCLFLSLMMLIPILAQSGDNNKILADPGKVDGRGRIAIFMDGSDPSYIRIFEDALTILLRKDGWDVPGRTFVGKTMTDEIVRISEAVSDSSSTLIDDFSKPAMAKILGAEYYLTGTIIFGRKQYVIQYGDRNSSIEKAAVTSIAYSIENLTTGETEQEAVLEFLAGESFSMAAERVVEVILDGE
jgi:hypothetical protein